MHKITRSFDFVSIFTRRAMGGEGEEPFAIPFIEDLHGKTALHLSLEGEAMNTRVTEHFLRELLP